jgi:hypothetical protein
MNGQKKMNRQRTRKDGRKQEKQRLHALIPAYKGQPTAELLVRLPPVTLSTTVTTGAIAESYQLVLTNVTNWATRFQTLWEECRIISAIAEMSTFSTSNPGLIVCYWQEKNLGAPTATSAEERTQKQFSASSNRKQVMKWSATDFLDLQYQPTNGPNTPVSLAIYTDNANYGSSATATPYLTVTLVCRVQFRGYVTD